jgi:hypothetical protein
MTWRQITTGTVTQFAVGRIQKTELTLNIPEQRSEHYRVRIENRDSPPLAITGVDAIGPIYELTFLATRGQDLILHYGLADVPQGHFDTAALREALGQSMSLPAGELGAPRENLNAKPSQSWKPWNDTRVLLGAIVALTALFGWGLYLAGRRVINTLPPGDS